MKASDIWVGNVPDGWTKERLKNSVASIQAGIWGDEPRGDETDIRCVRVADFDRPRLAVADENATLRSVSLRDQERFRLAKGDLLLEKSGGTASNPVGFVALFDSDVPAVCSNFIGRVRLHPGQIPRFWMYAHAASYYYRITQRSLNQTTGIQNLDLGAYLNEVFPFPPQTEQQAIADFLDRETAQIDAMIEAQRGLVARLEERRHSVSDEVLRGAEAAEGSFSIPLQRACRAIVDCHHSTPEVDEQGVYEAVRTASVRDGKYRPEANLMIGDHTYRERVRGAVPEPGDVFFTREAPAGEACLVPQGSSNLCLGQRMVLLKVDPSIVAPALVVANIYRTQVQDYFTLRMNGSTVGNLKLGDIRRTPIVVPPPAEQPGMVQRISEVTARIDAMIGAATDSIALMQERRAALISSAVTGRIDPRTGQESTPEMVLESV